jgi:putative ABC transport system ATP-binding protein
MTPATSAATATTVPADVVPLGRPDAVVEITDAQKFYALGERRLHVLKGISLRIERGEYVAIMGPSGSGKSTLLNILVLLDTLDSGGYQLAGDDVSRLSDQSLARARARLIGFIFQSFNLFAHLDVVRNIEVPMAYAGVPRRERRQRAKQLAERVGLGHRLDHKPRQLSGGEMQRTAIARALSNRPPLLLADEPTGNLDERTGNEIMGLFDELVAGGQTLVLVTHNPIYRTRVARVLDMQDGNLMTDPPIAGAIPDRTLPHGPGIADYEPEARP